jgi:hypothetical protein
MLAIVRVLLVIGFSGLAPPQEAVRKGWKSRIETGETELFGHVWGVGSLPKPFSNVSMIGKSECAGCEEKQA